MTEDEMVGWHHGLNAHEFEEVPGDVSGEVPPCPGDGQGNLECCSPRGHRESDTTEQQQNFCCL